MRSENGREWQIEKILNKLRDMCDDSGGTAFYLAHRSGDMSEVSRSVTLDHTFDQEFEAAVKTFVSSEECLSGEVERPWRPRHGLLHFDFGSRSTIRDTNRSWKQRKDSLLKFWTRHIVTGNIPVILNATGPNADRIELFHPRGPAAGLLAANAAWRAAMETITPWTNFFCRPTRRELEKRKKNEKRNKQIVNRMEKSINGHFPIVIWPDIILEKDINDMILSGLDVQSVIESNVYSGLQAKTKLTSWKKT